MERRAAGRSFFLITVLLGYCIVLSSPAIIRNPNRLWKIDLSDQSINNKQRNPFMTGPDSWNQQLPSILLHNWSVKMLPSNVLPNEPTEERARKLLLQPIARQILFGSNEIARKVLPNDVEISRAIFDQRWLPPWPASEELDKRNIVVADDAAFREKSKMLTAMERQKWLNSYMQKLLVVNST
ncbi:PREDICTED: tuberoinfundibular peptide of 39 residues [Nanorana parkeri]|uniref:tuberoinfundibular peptide of 39 residues n=1 Tax=Nanorana parkeri TaxID=125878 RepID=UPI000854BEF0|nr:PREDICTED: tuberoinfundibular peptide of 39 residues [Nanorana parkeri]